MMDLAVVIARRPARLRELGARLEGLGLVVETYADAAAPSSLCRVPRVVLWDEDAPDVPAGYLPGPINAAPVHLRISAAARAWVARPGAIVLPAATEGALLTALLDSGYALPADAECASISRTLHGLVNGDAAVVARLVDSLLCSGVADLASYRALCAQKNWVAAGSLAHRLKGTIRMAGCVSLARVCERVEFSILNGATADFTRLNALFEPAVRRLCAELQKLRRAC
ncbi:Hpt domain-containing protein [Achromobacter sp. NPDC058515]|uniref:Hpt domain-containing protein n=1 Tax=Achromobacter sp. NPDC058515 TaxID=3346533 RepID=UPI0036626C48